MRKLLKLVVVMAVALLPATAAFAQEDTAAVSVLHGIPGDGGFPVDVYVNGDYSAPLLDDFTFETLAGPLDLAAGTYSIEIYPGDADPNATDPALGPLDVAVEAGGNYTIVAHLTEGGDPTASVFVNDTSSIAAGESRVTVRHTAAAPTVDVLAGGEPLFEGLSNPNEVSADVPADTYPVAVVPAGGSEADAVFSTDLQLPEGTNTIVYAIGSLEGGSFTVAAQAISGLGEEPAGVPTGTSGLAGDGFPVAAVAVMGIAALAVLGSGVALSRQRS